MGRITLNVLSMALVLLVAYSRHAECRELYKILLVDTPTKFQQLKAGELGAGYDEVNITANAHPNILLQPQYFANTTFSALTFNGPKSADGDNTITIYPGEFARVAISLTDIELSLDGVPKHYQSYYFKSRGQVEKHTIDSIVQWKQAVELYINEVHSNESAVKLQKRIADMSDMTKLKRMNFALYRSAYKVEPKVFINNLLALEQLWYHTIDMPPSEREALARFSSIPDTWSWGIRSLDVSFIKTIFDK